MKFNRACTYAVTTTFILASVPAAYAWGAAGHQIVATIAQIYLHSTTLSNVCEILYPGSSTSRQSPPCNLATIASWADQIKRQPKYRYTAPLHYIGALGDHPSEACAFPGPRGWAGKKDANVLGAVRNVTNILVEYTNGLYDAEAAADALKFLVHYLGDMHMPLHLTGRDRGGNGDRVTFDGRVTSKCKSACFVRIFPHYLFTRLAFVVGQSAHRAKVADDSYQLHSVVPFWNHFYRCRISPPRSHLRPLCPSRHVRRDGSRFCLWPIREGLPQLVIMPCC